jgi:hypothetical protein
MIYSENHGVYFADKKHLDFYAQQIDSLKNQNDPYYKALFYTLGICPDTRRNIDLLFERTKRSVCPDEIHAGWQTRGSTIVTRLAFNLFTDGCPTAYTDNRSPPCVSELSNYRVSDVFCCEYAPYFIEAIRLRYPEYMRDIRKENIRAVVNDGVPGH